ncbi:MAG: HAD family hydrolase [Candidatus Binatia bacterium]
MKPEAIVFDLFGTLVSFDDARVPTREIDGRRVPMTIPLLPELLARFLPGVGEVQFLAELRRSGAEILERKRREGVEVPTRVRFENALRTLGAAGETLGEVATAMAARHMDTLARSVVCPPGRVELLRFLARGHRLALLSNFDDGATARRVLAEAGLDEYFELIVISEEEGIRKPSREIFARTCRRLQLEPSRCLYIGDTLVEDIEGASGAGLAALWIRPEAAEPMESPALDILPDVDALPAWLASRRS